MKREKTALIRAGVGVSCLALAAVAVSPAWAEDRVPSGNSQTQGAPADSTQNAEAKPQDIVVTGRRAAIESADDRKKNAETLVDSVVADDAGKLPDNSITEVLQRVSGVAIVRFAALNDPDHFSVEGSGLQVRGLSGVASRLNGREIFGANGGRGLLWGDVTPELMAAVDVYKSATADLIEGGTGGQIDLRTKMPFDFRKPSLVISAGGSYGDMAEKPNYNISALVTDRWTTGIGEIGVLVDVARSTLSSKSDFFRMEPYYRQRISGTDYYIPGGYDYGDEKFDRKRTGIYAAVQWAPSPDLTFSGTFFQSRYENQAVGRNAFITSQNLVADPASSTFDANNALTSSTSLFVRNTANFQPSGATMNTGGGTGVSRSNTVTRDYSAAFVWAPDDSPFSLRGAFQRVNSRSIVNRYDVFRDATFPSRFGLDLRGDLPQLSVPAGAQATYFDRRTNYFFTATQPHAERNNGQLTSGNLDAEYHFPDDSFFRSVKVGGRWAERTERDLNNGFNWAALGRGWGASAPPQLTYANARPGDVEQYVFDNFFRGNAQLPGLNYFPTAEWVGRMDRVGDNANPPAGFCPTGGGAACANSGATPTGYGTQGIRVPGFKLPDDQTDYRTRTLAGYGLVRFGRDTDEGGLAYNGNVGVRVVNVQNASNGFFQQTVNRFIRDGVTYETAARSDIRSGGSEYTKILPALNFQILPQPDMHLRFAYGRTMDIPSFTALRAQGSLGVNTTTPSPNPQNLPGTFNYFTANAGNPALKPVVSNNFDVSFEWYPKRGTTFHVSGFYKRITDLIVYKATSRPIEVFYTLPTATSSIENATTIDVDNAGETATVRGVEAGGRIFFDMLPGLLGGLGIEANYTFIDSKNPGDQYQDIEGVIRRDLPIQGMSRHNFNTQLLYEKGSVSARVAYSWRSKYLQSTTANGTSGSYNYYAAAGPASTAKFVDISLPIYGDAYGTVDAGIRFKVNKNFSWSIEGTNLLNATQRTLMGGPNNDLYVRSWFQSDRRISTGINLAF